MKHRQLRIAWSVAWGAVAVLLCVLWVRSYWWYERVIWGFGGNRVIQAGHVCGQVRISKWQVSTKPSPTDLARVQLPIKYWQTEDRHRADGSAIDFPDSATGFGGEISPAHLLLYLPYWFLAGTACCVIALPWFPYRFSLRTLFIATTVVAVALGLIVWASREKPASRLAARLAAPTFPPSGGRK